MTRQARTLAVAEIAGYVGGVLGIAAWVLVLRRPDLFPLGAELAVVGIAWAALGAAGLLLRTADPASDRLRSGLWLMSTISLAAFMILLDVQVWKLSADKSAIVAAAVTAVYAALLWLRARMAPQLAGLFVTVSVLVAAVVITALRSRLAAWQPGLAVWGAAVLWAVAVWRGWLTPRTAGYILAAIGMLVGAGLTLDVAAGYAIAVVTVLALIVAGVLLGEPWLVVLGAVNGVSVIPFTAIRYLSDSTAVPVALFAAALVIMAAAVLLARRSTA